MLLDITFHKSVAGWFIQLIGSIKNMFNQGKNKKDENYFLIN